MDEWLELKANLIKAAEESSDLEAIEAIRISAVGKKGSITGLMKSLGSLNAESRKEAGQLLNKIKTEVTAAIDSRKVELESSALEAQLSSDVRTGGRVAGVVDVLFDELEYFGLARGQLDHGCVPIGSVYLYRL